MGESDYMSPRAVEYTGLPLSDLVAGKWLKVVHPADQFRAAAVWRAALQSGTSYDVEFRIRSQSGVYRWFKSVARPVRDVEGKITRWIGISTDIDDQKRSEEALEAAVARRTLELAEARDRAEAATRAKSQFLAAMSHEIRTPMNGVIGMANVMLDTDLTSEQRCYMDTIRSSGQALLIVINDILDLSKIEAGRLDLERTEFDLSTLIEEAVELIGPQAAAKNLALQCDVDDSIPLDLLGDPARLRQIVLNLLNNAVKFTSTGSITLFVTREANQSHMTVLRFAIRDTGIGLTQKQQDGLFQPFQQADLSTSRRFGGTGLGLVISKRLVEMMGGSIGVHSQVGEGSTFWFNVYLETASVFADWERFAGKRVVMVSHHPKAASVICSYLQTVGLCITTYARLPRPDRTAFDLLLVDSAAVPQASDAVQLANFDRGPILILGTQADVRSIPMPEKTEIVFVPKPVRRLPLLRAIESALEGKMSVEEPASPSSLPPGHRGRVLLADDNKVNQLVARILLEKLGYCVDVVDNGMEACNAVQRQLYDIVLMDCQMPVMNGFQATQRIRSVEIGGRHTPIIAVTAGVLKEERDRCYACGMDDFLSKPISQEDLANTLGKWIPIQEKRAS
jgi:PAS domain S-box-containing protein